MSTLAFKLDLRNPGQHEFRLSLELEVEPFAAPTRELEFFLPVWTPGSYLVREYARHVSRLRACDARSGISVDVRKTRKNRWALRVPRDVERVRVSWSVYGHELTVRTADLTESHALWNGACLFLWPVGHGDTPASIEVTLPPGWDLASELRQTRIDAASRRLEAKNLDELVDTPCLAGTLRRIPFVAAGKAHEYVLEGLDGIEPPASLVPDTRRVVEEAAKIFGGELPYEHYSFLSLFTDQGRGGLEHLTSTVLLAPRTTWAPRKNYEDFLSLVAHEHFHLWNVKRIVPEPLWDFDYENENYTSLLWVAEGFTSYYDDLLCLRAGVYAKERYLEVLADGIAELRSVPGRLEHPLALASYDTWIKFYRPDEHTKNSTQSYYSSGALAALCLDLTIRARSAGSRSLDDALRGLWHRTWGQRRPYAHADVVTALSEAAGCDLEDLVTRLVEGPFDPDFGETLALVGMRLVRKEDKGAYLGISWKSDELVIQSVVVGDPAHEAGLAPGDEVLAIQGLRARSANWKSLLENLDAVGKPLEVLVARRGRILTRTIVPRPVLPTLRIEAIPEATEEQKRLRAGWLGSA